MIEAAIANFAEKSKPDSSSSFIVYNLVVFDRSTNAVTRFPKRYSEFYDLHEKIKSLDPDIAAFPFPPKRTTLANKQKTAIDRKNAFNAYLVLLLQKDTLPLKVRQFLGLSPPSPTVTPIKTSEVVLASLSRMLSPSNKIKSKTTGDGDMHSAKVNASRHDDENSMKIASVNGIKSTDGTTSSQGDGTGVNGNGRRDNMRAVKSSGRVFTGKPRKRGFWTTLRIPLILFVGAVVLIASGWLFMQYMSIDEIPQTKVGQDPLSAVNSFDTLIVGEGPAKSSSMKGNRKGNNTRRTKKSDKNGTKASGKKRKGNKAASTMTGSTLTDNNEKEDSSEGTTTTEKKLELEGKGQGKMPKKAVTDKETKEGSEFVKDRTSSEAVPIGLVNDVGVGVEVGVLGDSVPSTTSATPSTDQDDDDDVVVVVRQESAATAHMQSEASNVETEDTITVVNDFVDEIDDNNDGSDKGSDSDSDIDNDNGDDNITGDNLNSNDHNRLSESTSQEDVTDRDRASINDDTITPEVEVELEVEEVTSPSSNPSSPNQPPSSSGFVTKLLIPFLAACISIASTLFSMAFAWVPWLLRRSTGASNRLLAVVLMITTGVFLLSHKISASLLGWYLRRILGADKKPGAFRLAISSLHFRFGWDRHEIVVDDFIWYNPPSFKSTPHFVRIGTITLRYNLQSVVMALFSRKTHSIMVHCVELEDVEMFMEKMDKTRDRSTSQRQHGMSLPIHSHLLNTLTPSQYTHTFSIHTYTHTPSQYTDLNIHPQINPLPVAHSLCTPSPHPSHTPPPPTPHLTGTTNNLNMWAAMGARDEAEEKLMNSTIQKYIAKATKTASNKVMSYIRSTPSPTTVDGTHGSGNNFPSSSSSSSSSSYPTAVGSNMGANQSASSTPRQSRSHSKSSSSSSSSSVVDPFITSTTNPNPHTTPTHSKAPLESMSTDSDKNSTTSHVHSNNSHSNNSHSNNSNSNNSHSNNSHSNSVQEEQPTHNANNTTTKTNKHFGVPFLIVVHRFVLQGRVHPSCNTLF